jgi:hypothetical protein
MPGSVVQGHFPHGLPRIPAPHVLQRAPHPPAVAPLAQLPVNATHFGNGPGQRLQATLRAPQ